MNLFQRMHRRLLTLFLIAYAFVCLPGFAQNEPGTDRAEASPLDLRLSVGGIFSRGDYADPEDTDIIYLPLSLSAYYHEWRASATVPYLFVEGPADIFTQDREATGSAKQDGLGDIYLGLSRQLPVPGLHFTLGGQVKLPTGDNDKRLGTGEADYIVKAEAAREVLGLHSFGTLGYRFSGDPSYANLDDRILGTIGVQRPFGRRTAIGVSYDYLQSATSHADDSHEAGLHLIWLRSRQVATSFFVRKGFTDASPELAGGFQVQWRRK